MPAVRIYQPSKTAMQSGRKKTKNWLIEFKTMESYNIEPLMGWISSSNTLSQLHIYFPTLKEAIQFSKLKGLNYTICNPPKTVKVPKSYGLNFTCPRIRG